MKNINIILVLLLLVIAAVSCVDEPDGGKFPASKYYYDIDDVPVDADYVIGVMYHELNTTYWFKSTNNIPDFSQPQGYTGHPLLGDPAKKGDSETNGGYSIGKDYYNGSEIMRKQLAWAKQAGIDFLLVNWNRGVRWNNAIKVDTFMLNFVNAWKPGDPKIAFVFECGHLYNDKLQGGAWDSLHTNVTSPYDEYDGDGNPIGTKQTFLRQLDSLKTSFFNEAYYYKLADGRPLFGLNTYERTNSVASTVADIRNVVGNVYLISPTLTRGNGYTSIEYIYNIKNTLSIKGTGGNKGYTKDVYLFRENGEQYGTPQMPFDAMYQPAMLTDNYSRHGEDNWKRNYFSLVDYNYNDWKQKMEAQGKDYIPSVMPAFDNRANDSKSLIFVHPREVETGSLYNSYANVGKRNANSTRRIIIINSWNDFKQGSGLEPTQEYGESYLNFTKKYFKKN